MTTLLWPNGQTVEPARSDGYGPRQSILTSAGWTRPFHVGTDHYGIGAIRSPGAGTVVESGWSDWGGNQVLIYHGEIDGRRAWVRLCHLAAPSPLARGDQIARGGFVGIEGATGQAAGRHLHWEVYIGRVDRGSGSNPGATVDPRTFIINHLGDDMGTLDNTEENYQVFATFLQRALKFDARENGKGPDWKLGNTIWEKIAKSGGGITPEQVKQIAEQVVKAIGQPTVTLDYAAIAKAVNDEAARRLAS